MFYFGLNDRSGKNQGESFWTRSREVLRDHRKGSFYRLQYAIVSKVQKPNYIYPMTNEIVLIDKSEVKKIKLATFPIQ